MKVLLETEHLVPISDFQLYAEPPVGPEVGYLLDRAVPGRIHHICSRKHVNGKKGLAQVLRTGAVRWCLAGHFWCDGCSDELDFETIWEQYLPPQMEMM